MIYGLAVHCKQTLSVFSEVGVSPPSFVTYTGCIAVSVCVQEKDREKEKKEGGRTTHCKIYTCRCTKGNPNLIENGLPVLLVCVCVCVCRGHCTQRRVFSGWVTLAGWTVGSPIKQRVKEAKHRGHYELQR